MSGENNKNYPRFVILGLILLLAVLFLKKDYKKLDYLAYKTAYSAFIQDINPYQTGQLLKLQKLEDPSLTEPMMVWNPPMYFSSFGLIFNTPEALTKYLWVLISIFCALAMLRLGFLYSGAKNPNNSWILICGLTSVPLFLEIIIGQFSSWICCMFVLGVYLLKTRYSLFAGFLMSLSLIKPHLFVFQYIVLLLYVFKKKDFIVVLGGLMGILFFSGFSEIRYPDIHKLWIFREQWPHEVLGSTLPSLIRLACIKFSWPDSKLIQILSFFCGIVVMGFYCFKHFNNLLLYPLLFSFCLNPLFSPYGFVFDQIYILFVFGFILGSESLKGAVQSGKAYDNILRISIFHILVWLLSDKVYYYWFILPPLATLFFLYNFRKTAC